jgi:hypothetical protein
MAPQPVFLGFGMQNTQDKYGEFPDVLKERSSFCLLNLPPLKLCNSNRLNMARLMGWEWF